MADMIDTLKSILGDDAEGKIRSALGTLNSMTDSSNDEKNEQEEALPASTVPKPMPTASVDGLGQIMKLKSLANDLSQPNDARSQLLMSLKPYMRSSRQKGIDDAIRLLNITKFSQLFK